MKNGQRVSKLWGVENRYVPLTWPITAACSTVQSVIIIIFIIIIIIIIITNEKIKVTLSRKRCRGTLQDYNKGEISKCQAKLWTNRNVWMERGRKQFEEMVVDCSMHAVM